MKVRLKDDLLIVTAETEEERASVAVWAASRDGHVFQLQHQDSQTVRLTDLGVRAVACREPINITSRSSDPAIQLISNLAHTPFELDGERYASVEAFWQGLKFPDAGRRRTIATLYGQEARVAGLDAEPAEAFDYLNQTLRVGTVEHWRLMTAACWAKFNQHGESQRALLGTGDRPLEHRTRRDSRNIPGVIMADIWMKVRRGLVKRTGLEDDAGGGDEQGLDPMR